MKKEDIYLELFGFSRPTFYKWKREKRPIVGFVELFDINNIKEYLDTGSIENLNNLVNSELKNKEQLYKDSEFYSSMLSEYIKFTDTIVLFKLFHKVCYENKLYTYFINLRFKEHIEPDYIRNEPLIVNKSITIGFFEIFINYLREDSSLRGLILGYKEADLEQSILEIKNFICNLKLYELDGLFSTNFEIIPELIHKDMKGSNLNSSLYDIKDKEFPTFENEIKQLRKEIQEKYDL
jgi:hypothetical protein